MFKSVGVVGRSRGLIESCPMSLCLWPVAMMSSFSLGTQWVNGCWDYAMACQTPFSSPALLSTPLPLQTGWSQNRHSCTFWSDAFECFGTNGGNKTGISFHSEGKPPLTRASHLPYRGKVVVRIYDCRGGWYLQSVKPVKTSVFTI